MKKLIIICGVGTCLLLACGHSTNNIISSDTSSNAKKADTSVVSGNSKNVKNDSIGGDPAAKGSEDPNAHEPKK